MILHCWSFVGCLKNLSGISGVLNNYQALSVLKQVFSGVPRTAPNISLYLPLFFFFIQWYETQVAIAVHMSGNACFSHTFSSKGITNHLWEKHCILSLSSMGSRLLPVRGEDPYLNYLFCVIKAAGTCDKNHLIASAKCSWAWDCTCARRLE